MSVTIDAIKWFDRIEVDRSPADPIPLATQQRVDDAWSELCAQNPRYFNGSILVFDRFDPESKVIHARVDQYKHHATRHISGFKPRILSVTAYLTAIDRERVKIMRFLGKRSHQTHDYGGLWEFGPSGGVDVPCESDSISFKELHSQIDREILEEIGPDIPRINGRLCALLHDHQAGSTDLVSEFVFDRAPEVNSNWEYDDTRWVTREELNVWVDTNPSDFIPPVHELVRFLEQNPQ